jgi:glycosyltransferase involved in cell wall biosynthesis
MRIAIVAPPFIPVPPIRYGGTELFVAHLADGLRARGHDVAVYANGASRIACHLEWRYADAEWPIVDAGAAQLKNIDHTAWALHDAAGRADVVQLNDVVGVPLTPFLRVPVVLTLHHPHEPALTALYQRYPEVDYVAISAAQARREPLGRVHVIHHGLPMNEYRYLAQKDDYVAFLGRMAPCKGAHLAIDAARRAGVRLKLAGEIQPIFREYWERQVLPGIDGRQIEYVGEADHEIKNALLSRARALLFPITWDEPFGLVMVEAMACGTPVLALRGGSVAEVVRDGVSGWICSDTADMAARIAARPLAAEACRAWAVEEFSRDRMVDRYLDVYARARRRPARPAAGDGPPPVRAGAHRFDRAATAADRAAPQA